MRFACQCWHCIECFVDTGLKEFSSYPALDGNHEQGPVESVPSLFCHYQFCDKSPISHWVTWSQGSGNRTNRRLQLTTGFYFGMVPWGLAYFFITVLYASPPSDKRMKYPKWDIIWELEKQRFPLQTVIKEHLISIPASIQTAYVRFIWQCIWAKFFYIIWHCEF